MQLIKWNPTRDLFNLRHNMNGLFDDFFYPRRGSDGNEGLWNWNPAVDIYEDADNIVVKAEIPGVNKEGITVDVKDRVLTLKGERSEDKEVKEDSYYRKERTYGRFERAFTLPADVKTEDIKAEYKDGVLKVIVPKPEVRKPKQITVH
ncbi:MAG: Hsp20/alpha crystallin family protein [Desulfobacteraceae bacterium]|jgi:HSP20 family protein